MTKKTSATGSPVLAGESQGVVVSNARVERAAFDEAARARIAQARRDRALLAKNRMEALAASERLSEEDFAIRINART